MTRPDPNSSRLPHFATTRWTLVDRVHSDDPGQRDQARAELFQIYWPAIYAHLRRRGRTRDDAAELTQGFFADVLLGRELFEKADRERGRVRSLVLTALKRYCIDASRRRAARPEMLVPREALDREEAIMPVEGDPDEAFERRWAASIIGRSLSLCEAHYLACGREGHWRAFEARILGPALRFTTPPPLAALTSSPHLRTPEAVAAALQTVKRQLAMVLREHAGVAGDDLAEEGLVAELLSKLGASSPGPVHAK